MNKRYYDKIYIIQSYPNLTFLVNELYKQKLNVAVIVSIDKSIFKFLKKLNISNVSVFLVGNAIVYRKKIFSPIRLLYTKYIWYKIPSLKTKTLIITYANWADIGALYLKKIKFIELEQYIAYAEKRYDISSDQKINFSSFQKFIQSKTNGLIENKKYSSFVKGKKVVMKGVGLVDLKTIWPNVKTYNLKNIVQINEYVVNSYKVQNEFYLFIDKDLVKSNQISWLKLIKLYYDIKLIFKKKSINIAFKFKPRHFSFFKYLILRVIGFKILSTEPPSELYASQKKCIGIIGFTSSSMSVDYGKKLISLSTLKNTYKKSLIGNIESMKQRNESKSDNIIFIEHLSQLVNVT